ncbi:MAG: hypothetical protein JNK82_17885 [Myxococcaceae bacterium]|nr:hypothetical protein [Myxococcaceae bacterium]
MLRTFFDAVEKHLGPSLETAATVIWALGLALISLQVLAPFARVAVQLFLGRAGLEQTWVMACPTCGEQGVLGSPCLKCGGPELKPGALARLFARNQNPSPTGRRVRWALSLFGALGFLAGTFWLMSFSSTSNLERLFLGAALITYAGVGAFLGRALGARGGGPLSRLRELFFAAAAAVLMSGCLYLQQHVRALPENVLVHVTASPGSVDLDGAKLQLKGNELGLELQLIEGAGLSRALPLAWVGATRSEIALGVTDAWLRDSTWNNAGLLLDLGVQVKRRTETFPMSPGQKYELVMREKDVGLRLVKSP